MISIVDGKGVSSTPELAWVCIPLLKGYSYVVGYIQGEYVGFNTENGEKLSYSQAVPGQASCLALA